MSARDYIGPSRALLGTDEQGTEVYGAWQWPGGLLLIDAFRPDRYRRLHLSADELETPFGIRLREMHNAGDLDPGSVDLPETWVRAAVVDAVDRWVDLPLDADLLLADRALAAAETDNTTMGAELFDRARQALADLVDSVDGAYQTPEALLTELTRVLRATPEGYGVRPPRTTGEPSIGDTFAALAQEERRSRARAVLYNTKGSNEAADEGPVGAVPVLHHPLLVPVQLLRGAPVATVADGRIQVVGPAVGGVSTATPATGRLLLSAVDAQTLRVGAVAPFLFDGGAFRGTIRPVAGGVDSTLVVVHDSAATSALSLTPDMLVRAASLTALRDAFGAERLAAAHQDLADPSGVGMAQQARIQALMSAPQTPPTWLDLGGPLAVAARLEHACRPLLAELALAHT